MTKIVSYQKLGMDQKANRNGCEPDKGYSCTVTYSLQDAL